MQVQVSPNHGDYQDNEAIIPQADEQVFLSVEKFVLNSAECCFKVLGNAK